MQTIGREQLKQWMDEKRDFVLIETLPQEKFQEAHLPGAINIPTQDEAFESKAREAVPDKDEPVVVYCANTECPASPEAAKKLEGMGYTEVYDYEAGKQDWREAGYETLQAA